MKLLVRIPNWVGDAVMAIPALEAIKRAHPESDLCILARPTTAELFSNQPFADRILTYDFPGRHKGWSGRERLVAELRRERFDVALLLQNAFEAAWIARRSRIPEIIGYARDARGFLLTKGIRVPVIGEIPPHESFYYLELLRRAGWIHSLPETTAQVRLGISDSARETAENILRSEGSRENSFRIAVGPGASYGAAKCWPAEKFATLADRLISECGADVIIFGTESEKGIASRILSGMKSRAISLVGRTSMHDLAALFASCSLFIGNDSGAMHVAAAAGIPVVGIFGSTDPKGTSPLTSQFTLIREEVSCSPCFLRRCPVDHRCMNRIAVELVFDAARRINSSADNSNTRSRVNG